jgi:CBS domain-containing protein
MRTNVEMIPASATFDEVLHFIERSRFNHFPVVQDDGTLFGMVHFSDLHDLIYDPAMADLVTALDVADPESAVVPMDMPLSDLLDVFTGHHVGVLPVVERQGSRHIVGLVEQRDLLRTLRLMDRENTTKG